MDLRPSRAKEKARKRKRERYYIMYTDLQYVFPLEDRYKCPICSNALDAPRQTSCGHRFCDRCLQQAFRKGTARCPVDKEVLSADEVFRDRCAEREILQLVVYCPNKEAGCKEQLPLKELESHLQECKYTRVECVHKGQGCDVLFPRHQLAEHLEKECNFRQVSCKFCSETIPLALVQDHLMQCPKATMSCPNGCGLTDVTKDRWTTISLRTVPLLRLNAATVPVGVLLSQLEEHNALSMAEHLSMLTGSLARLELSYSESRRELQEVSNQRDLLQSTVRQQATEITSLKQKVDKQDSKIGALQKMVASQTDKLIKFEGDLTTAAKKVAVEEQKRDLAAVKETVKRTENRLTTVETRRLGGGGGGLFSGVAGEVITQLAAQDRQLGIHDVRLAEMDLRFQILETVSFDGTLLWKIKDYTRRKHDAVTGRTLSLYSQPFYTSRNGYKMCARGYLNGDGMGKDTHMSLFFVVMRGRGEYDALLPWPFRQKVTLMLLDQDQGRRHLSDTFRPDPTSSSFKRPTSDMNIASGCPLFVSQAVVEGSPYLKDDTIFIKVIVETSDLVGP
ncbi:TRAF3 [Branchiostoma lanceolatum]|uniref:TRAF3 protein n=1 Tax=Branchiostoma lanceolatum TaxID=7740 RepID=A0A8J9ZSW3_BRALA|nr:TRAF3 [Branchiostoma lanceolatum]